MHNNLCEVNAVKEQSLAKRCKALGDENRILILQQLRGGEKCACKLLEALDISQPTLSHHMKLLCDCGLVSGRKEGKWMHYAINSLQVQQLMTLLEELLTPENHQTTKEETK